MLSEIVEPFHPIIGQLGCAATLPANGSSWSFASDRQAKENFKSVDGLQLLARLNAIPIETWNYKSQDASIRHVGPMAQDFRAAFGLGEDEKYISTVDIGGVSLAGVQALYRLLLQKDEQARQQQAEIRKAVEQVHELQVQLQELRSEIRQISNESRPETAGRLQAAILTPGR